MRVRAISSFLFGVAMFCFVRPAPAQDTLPTSEEKHGLSLYEKFEGSTSADANVFDMNTSIGYDYSVHYVQGTVFFSAGFDLSRLFGHLSSH